MRLKPRRLQGQLHFSGAKSWQCGGGKGKLGKREARECFPSGGSRTFFWRLEAVRLWSLFQTEYIRGLRVFTSQRCLAVVPGIVQGLPWSQPRVRWRMCSPARAVGWDSPSDRVRWSSWKATLSTAESPHSHSKRACPQPGELLPTFSEPLEPGSHQHLQPVLYRPNKILMHLF